MTPMDATGALSRSSGVVVKRGGRPRVSWAIERYLGLEVIKVFTFVLVVMELGYALLAAVVVSRRYDLDLLLLLAVPAFWSTALSMLNDSFPLALLFASGLVYGRFVADREVTALKSFGLSYGHLLSPLLVIGALSAFAGFFVNGFLAPAMNYQKNDIGALLASQLRYLGEGRNRDFPFGDHNLWILHYNGRRLEGIFLGLHGKDKAGNLLSEDVTRDLDPFSEPFYLFAEHGEVLFPEEVEREWARRLREAEARGDEVSELERGQPRPGTFLFRLHNVRLFFSDQIVNPREPSDFMQRMDLERLDFPYDPSALKRARVPKQLSFWELGREMERLRAQGDSGLSDAGEPGAGGGEVPGDVPQELDATRGEYVTADLEIEYHWRWARILSLLLYPVVAGLIALLLNAENRYLAFFVSCLLVPSVFYGVGTIGRVAGVAGFPPWLTMNSGIGILAALGAAMWLLLEKRILR